MRRLKGAILDALCLSRLVAMLLLLIGFRVPLKFPDGAAEKAVGVATALLVVAVFMERALAVILDLIVPAEERKLRERLVLGLSKSRGQDFDRYTRLLADKNRLRIILGFALALLVSLAGVRTLSNLVTNLNELKNGSVQLGLFNCIDVLLTAGLVAGGSAGIAAIIDFLKTRALLLLLRLRSDINGPRQDGVTG